MLIQQFLPDIIFHTMLVISFIGIIACFVFEFIPFISKYRVVLQTIFTAILAMSAYFEGSIANEAKWKVKVLELETKIIQAEAKSANENVKIVEKVVTKQKIIKERADAITEYIDREIVKYDENCVIPQAFIDIHNKSASRP